MLIFKHVLIQHMELSYAIELEVNYFVGEKLYLICNSLSLPTTSRVALLFTWTPRHLHVPRKWTPAPVHWHTAAGPTLGPRQPVGILGSLFQMQNSRPLSQTYWTRICIFISSSLLCLSTSPSEYRPHCVPLLHVESPWLQGPCWGEQRCLLHFYLPFLFVPVLQVSVYQTCSSMIHPLKPHTCWVEIFLLWSQVLLHWMCFWVGTHSRIPELEAERGSTEKSRSGWCSGSGWLWFWGSILHSCPRKKFCSEMAT